MEGKDREFVNFTLPALRHFWRPVVRMCLATSNNLLLVLYDAPKCIFSTNSRSSSQTENEAKTLFPTLHPLSPVIFATAAVAAFVLLRNSRFNFHCYRQREATPTQKSAQKWHCNLSRLLAWKVTKGIHSCKAASLKCPTDKHYANISLHGRSKERVAKCTVIALHLMD